MPLRIRSVGPVILPVAHNHHSKTDRTSGKLSLRKERNIVFRDDKRAAKKQNSQTKKGQFSSFHKTGISFLREKPSSAYIKSSRSAFSLRVYRILFPVACARSNPLIGRRPSHSVVLIVPEDSRKYNPFCISPNNDLSHSTFSAHIGASSLYFRGSPPGRR